ncbi:beta-1,6-glucan boisynthesis protein Knh1 [Aspergillus sclerotialis]|uniref:Beta-1,6-glucan boisynthesis protein Knh1 n=1 Tax=Aspergillus sclerotialis TaxID=2070753 RepID=A0A3A2ZDB9_9EURO|nr:beta-1,6-glucan boisynthesis protein Knh1 [Aspergillus sclerotialis]
MAGTFSPILVHGAHSLPHTSAFSEIGEEFRKQQAAGVDPGVAGLGVGARVGARDTDDNPYTIPYQLQTGPTRYAPMAKKPGTSITAKTATPQYPTSSYEIATSYLPQPTVQVTISAPLTYSTSSIENTASPAAQPVDAKMKRFLERWKD